VTTSTVIAIALLLLPFLAFLAPVIWHEYQLRRQRADAPEKKEP
jgi:hypothetical protein